MKIGVELSIDVTKIDKSRLFVGKKGTYLAMTAFIDTDQKDQYDNNGFISEKQTKEESDSKTYTTILGNSKVFWSDAPPPQYQPNQHQQPAQPAPQQYQPAPQQAAPQQQPPQTSNPYGDDFDDIPF